MGPYNLTKFQIDTISAKHNSVTSIFSKMIESRFL